MYPNQGFSNQGGFNLNPQPNAGGFNLNPQPNAGGFNLNPQVFPGGFNLNPQVNPGGFNLYPQPNAGGFNVNPMPIPSAYPPQQNMGYIPQQQQIASSLPIAQSNVLPQQAPSEVKKSPLILFRPSLKPVEKFDANNDASILRKAMKGFGTDEAALINVLCKRSHDQRMQLLKSFKTSFGRDLYSDVKSETSSNFCKVLLGLLTPIDEYIAKELHDAMEGLGTDEDCLIEVLCGMNNMQITKTIEVYQKLYNKKLESELRSETSGNFKKFLTSLMAAGRDESSSTDINKAKEDAMALKKAGVDRMGTDEQEFNRILCTRNFEQLKLVFQEYQTLTGSTFERDIEKEFSGDIKNALLAVVKIIKNPIAYYAERLHKSMVGLGTNDKSLIRLVITHCEVDMEDIKEEFLKKYGKTLKSFIIGDCSGDYKKALLTLINDPQ